MLRVLLATLSLVIGFGTAAQPVAEAPKDTPKEAGKKPAAAKPAAKAKATKPGVRPAWAELTTEQQQVLAPLKADWDSLVPDRRLKWVAIAKRYPRMKQVEQERVQRRMQMWAALSPDQRRQARENYKHLAKAQRPAPNNKDLRQAWAEYQALSPYERQSLAPQPSNDPRRQKR
ncbi:MAG: DUF3106 domain-containing protein [Betaproteobacteria bacterium]|nr:DUF3106 domain-containing protein [Betaproteobacteria bacterium]